MGHALAQIIFQGQTGLPEDVFVNTFHFSTPNATVSAGEATAIDTQLQSFYNVTHSPGTSPLGNELSSEINRALSKTRVYDMSQVPPRVPVLSSTWSLVATGGTSQMPNEVALCLSYKSSPVAGVPLAMTRGRIYLGPLMKDNWASGTGDLVPGTTVLNKMKGAGTFLSTPFSGLIWSVFSQRAKDLALSATGLFPISSGFIDNAADTQRRRGKKAASRTLWP